MNDDQPNMPRVYISRVHAFTLKSFIREMKHAVYEHTWDYSSS